ncbi:hypothetical protein GXM_00691 [Nostoc sphaeroides CCNUC1]|uniref:Uncharacterized protein n=1 Tax=Nostoc sphaeroides CCNUC1 TaxID=2653204 RepID=A0A5P8VRZ5_9NOSO|nr:hypothetical protein GXM_00691 [Nostoc sphaeroides CCNUC1]
MLGLNFNSELTKSQIRYYFPNFASLLMFNFPHLLPDY